MSNAINSVKKNVINKKRNLSKNSNNSNKYKKTLAWRVAVILAIVFLSISAFTPINQKINLGLDLKGGTHLVLDVHLDEAIQLQTRQAAEQLKAMFRDAHIPFQNIKVQNTTTLLINGVQKEHQPQIQEILSDHFPNWNQTPLTENEESPLPRLRLTLSPEAQQHKKNQCIQQCKKTIRSRVDGYGVADAVVQKISIGHEDKILVLLPGVDDPTRVKNLIKSTAMLEFKGVAAGPFQTETQALTHYNVTQKENLPDDVVLFQNNPNRMEPGFYVLKAASVVSGSDLKTAKRLPDGFGAFDIGFSLNNSGMKKIKSYTAANIGKPMAIVFDNQVECVATIQNVLSYDNRITGHYKLQEADDMVLKLQSGALSASMTPIEERIIGPSLGADSIKKGVTAAAVGLLLVIAFMVFFYRLAGINAVIALLLNLLVILAVMAVGNFTLTLPGIAGIILTIGMSVDANVLIFERIKEELQKKKTIQTAIADGFKKAFVTIFDANITTVIAALFLFQFGTGTIKGFSVTLITGICTSMFTALFVSRVLFQLALTRKGLKEKLFDTIRLSSRPSARTSAAPRQKSNTAEKAVHFQFMRRRYLAFALSALLFVAGIVAYHTNGFNRGIDFTGGIMMEVGFEDKTHAHELREALAGIRLEGATIQEADRSGTRFFIKTTFQEAPEKGSVEAPSDELASHDSVTKRIKQVLVAEKGEGKVTFFSTQKVGPRVGEDLRGKVVRAAIWSLLGMLVYIGARFKWPYGVAAVLTLFHDILICLAFILLLRIELSLPVAAALLTIIGYSLNDTIVIFDRVRDNLKLPRQQSDPNRRSLETILDTSIGQTLRRTFVTSITTLLAAGALLLFGGEVLYTFSLTLFIGVIVGTYSSIFQSCAWLAVLKKKVI